MTRKHSLSSLGRRRFLQGIGAVTITSGVVGAATAPDGTPYDQANEAPRLHGWRQTNHDEIIAERAPPEREPVYSAISRAHWRMVEAADDLRERVQARLSDLNPTPSVGMRLADGKAATDRRTIVVQHITVVSGQESDREVLFEPTYSYETLKIAVKERFADEMSGVAGRGTDAATTVEGMPVTTEQVIQRPSSNYYDYEYRKVPAGCRIEVDDGNGGTLGTYAFDDDTFSYVFVSAGHVLSGADDVYQETRGDSGDSLGDVNTQKVEVVNNGDAFDAGVIFGLDLNGKYKFAADSPGSFHGPEVTGALSESGVKDIPGTNETVYKQGCATGKDTGGIATVDGDMSEADHDDANGDSGGPYWVERNGDAYIAGIHHGPAGDIFVKATMMSSIDSEFNIRV